MNRTPVVIVLVLLALGVAGLLIWGGGSDEKLDASKSSSTSKTEAPGAAAAEGLPAVANASKLGDEERATAAPEAPAAAAATKGKAADASGTEIAARVVAAESSAPIESARIWLEESTNPYFLRMRMDEGEKPAEPDAISGADGSFKLRDVKAGKGHTLRVEAPGRVRQRVAVTALGAKESRKLEDVALALGGLVEGRVTDSNGKPIEKARVSVQRAASNARAVVFEFAPPALNAFLELEGTTDAQGRYRVDGVPAEKIAVSAYADDRVSATSDPVDVRGGTTRALPDLVLRDGKEITGRVVDKQGVSVAGAEVSAMQGAPFSPAFNPRAFGRRASTTDGEGRFRIGGLGDGPVRLTAQLAGKGVARKRDVEPGTRDLVMELGELGVIRGRVVLPSDVPAEKAAEAYASFQASLERIPDRSSGMVILGGPTFEGATHPDGTFEIEGIERGKYRVAVEGDGFAPAISTPLDVVPERPIEDLKIPVQLGAALEVHVARAGNSEPVEGARVRVRQRAEGQDAFGQGDDDEDEEASPFGEVVRRGPGGRIEAERRVAATAATAAGAPGAAGPPRGARFTSGPPRGARRASIGSRFGDLGNADKVSPIDRTATTDAKGVARFSGLPAARVEIGVRKEGFASPVPVESALETGAPEATNVSVALSEGGALAGVVVRGGTVPASGVNVEVVGPDPLTRRKRATTDAEGRYRFDHLAAGAYHAVVKKGGAEPGMLFFDETRGPEGLAVAITDGKVASLDLEAPALATITGTVTQAGAPVSGATVSLQSADGGPGMPPPMLEGGRSSASSGPDGKYKIENVEVGAYKLRASKPGALRPLERDVTLAAGSQKQDVALPLGVIEGRVVRKEGHEPVANATVSLVDAKPADGRRDREMVMVAMTDDSSGGGPEVIVGDGRRSTRTDAEGRFKLEDLPAGHYRVKAVANGLREGKSEELVLETDARLGGVEVALEKSATLVGRVLTAGGAPKPRTMVRLVGKEAGPGPGKLAMSDNEGRFRFTSLDPGDYTLTTGFDFGGGASTAPSVAVALEAGVETTKDLVVE